ncbi:unnamed protein product [Adineta steineri]|uniref:Uncharacterized protein n=1 Tax=Adineta steineri TaxID=433720 RepID=A0A819I9W6_9BILA|nr:unnamed protein product [Adineta steineri]CAF3911382.1 unnamed protein product [Adineta steineri]
MKHELVEVFIQIIIPMREWYIIFCNQDNLNKYLLNEFTLHAQGKIEIDSKQQKSLTIPDRWTIQDVRSAYAQLSTCAYQYGSSFQKKIKTLHVLLPSVETKFLPVRILKFIYSSKTKTKMNQSTNVEVRGKYDDNICGIGQEGTYSFDVRIFPVDNKIEESVFTFESMIIQQVQRVQSGRWSMEKTIYDKLNLTTDLPNVDHKIYLNTILKDYYDQLHHLSESVLKNDQQWKNWYDNPQLNSFSNLNNQQFSKIEKMTYHSTFISRTFH